MQHADARAARPGPEEKTARAATAGDADPRGGQGPPAPLRLVGARPAFDLATLVFATSAPPADLPPEQAALLRACARPLSVAELSAHLGLPLRTVVTLLGELHARGHVELRGTREEQCRAASYPDPTILKALIDGLQRL
ncbi:DUF742 domain-containing protein [Streptomyces johnsoniae]|uniref:DUF742 domain-containing protein n=1 Tax=Streptomyces johnsoniae TaxID=3075532 RepID=A0ABU2S8M7_9ACTN|nr:DUF742 domain-containing protein [Streptomyces sp. DSM 41886]MDT0444179.1 DUF742 domain-containing protein [Streptomyces sp. DSM 41886]